MSEAWKQLDLEGGGLQSVNLQMNRLKRRPTTAYLLWLFFPLGLHRFYLKSPAIGLLYLAMAAATLFISASVGAVGLWLLLPSLALALYDLHWINGRIIALNKALKVALYMQKEHAPPADFQGRYVDDNETLIEQYSQEKERERAGHPQTGKTAGASHGRVPSFAEQEAMLKALQEKKKSSS